jgi:hypothetical protein
MMGIAKSSLVGGCEVVFYGQGMAHDPTSISAIFANNQLGGSNVGAPTARKPLFDYLRRGYRLQLSHWWRTFKVHNALSNGHPLGKLRRFQSS